MRPLEDRMVKKGSWDHLDGLARMKMSWELKRREGREGLELRAKPGEEENGFVFLWSEMKSLCLEVEGVSLGFEEGNGEGVVWVWVNCVILLI